MADVMRELDEAAYRIAQARLALLDNGPRELIDYSPDDGPKMYSVVAIAEAAVTQERLEQTYAPRSSTLAPFMRVYAVGESPLDAVIALGKRIGWGEIDNVLNRPFRTTGQLWYLTFTANGVSMKAGGRFVPGGAVLDWWQ